LQALEAAGFEVRLAVAGETRTGPWPAHFDTLAAFDAAAGERDGLTAALGLVWASSPAPADAPRADRSVTIVAAAGLPDDALAGVLPAGGPALALLVGTVPEAWQEPFDRAGWSVRAIAAETPLAEAAPVAGAALDAVLRGLA
jgi:hypothetical protein